MSQTDLGTPHLPSARWLPLGSLVPFACVAIAAAVTGVSAVTAIAGVLGALGPMIAARTFIISLDIRPDRSRWRAAYDVWWDRSRPNRYQRWYLPLIGAAGAGIVTEVLRTLVSFARAHAPVSRQVTVVAAGIGLLEGLFVTLVLALGFGLSSLLLTPRRRRAA